MKSKTKSSSKRQEYIIYTVIAVAIIFILGFLLFTSAADGTGNSVSTSETVASTSSGEVSLTILPHGETAEDTDGGDSA